MHYQKQKRASKDYCNICGNFSDLTWDHVPPKSCYNTSKIEYNPLFSDINSESDNYRHYISQNGIKYRSICRNCNNDILGARYDTELENLAKEIHKIITSEILIPPIITLPVKVNKLTRSIVGHILAARNNYDDENIVDIKLRKYFLCDSVLPPKDMRLLFRLFPYDGIVIIRDVAVGNIVAGHDPVPTGLINCLSFYPISFTLSQEGSNCGLLDLFSLCSKDIENVVKVKIDLLSYRHKKGNKLRPPIWPCNISDSGNGASFVIVGNSLKDSVVTQCKWHDNGKY